MHITKERVSATILRVSFYIKSPLSYKTKTIMQMMDAIKRILQQPASKPRYKSVGSPPFTEKKCSIFHKSSGLKIIKNLIEAKG